MTGAGSTWRLSRIIGYSLNRQLGMHAKPPVKALLALIFAFATTAIGGCGWQFPAVDPFGG